MKLPPIETCENKCLNTFDQNRWKILAKEFTLCRDVGHF